MAFNNLFKYGTGLSGLRVTCVTFRHRSMQSQQQYPLEIASQWATYFLDPQQIRD